MIRVRFRRGAANDPEGEALLAVLDPDVVVRAEDPTGTAREISGARTWAKGAIAFSRQMGSVQPALLSTFAGGKSAAVDVVSNAERLRKLDLASSTADETIRPGYTPRQSTGRDR